MTDQEIHGRDIASHLDDDVSPDIQERLRLARMQAVAIADGKSSRQTNMQWLPIGGAVAAGVLAVALIRDPALPPLPALDEQELEAANNIALLDELALLAWLEEQDIDAG
ncbi:MAG: hypothetical protein AAAFM81_15375 [Pseudomonadota bacterium]